MFHAEPIVWTLRLYDEPDGYERRLPYRAVATVSLMGDRAMICALHGRFSRADWRAIDEWLHDRGITTAEMERRGRVVTAPVVGRIDAGEAISEAARG